jgi:leucyl/phenylalanyl-tRNA--protein transferase
MLYLLDDTPPDMPFPDPGDAETEPNGLLAVGGDLAPRRLLAAYRAGIFPWFSEGQPILWWSPDPRMLLFPDELQVSRSLRKTLRRGRFEVSVDQAFAEVIRGCAGPRRDGDGTWLLPEMIAAYSELHRLGLAHSVETWQDGELVGGLYGVSLGRAFFGESMFSRASDASKVALVYLAELCNQAGFAFIDCQVYTEHLHRLGAREIPRTVFLQHLERALQQAGATDWQRPPRPTICLEAAR